MQIPYAPSRFINPFGLHAQDVNTIQLFRMTSEQFETLRLFMVIAVVVFRLAVMPRYLQSYLNMAYTKLEELKQEAGKVSNLDLQKMIARVFYYTTVVSRFKIDLNSL